MNLFEKSTTKEYSKPTLVKNVHGGRKNLKEIKNTKTI